MSDCGVIPSQLDLSGGFPDGVSKKGEAKNKTSKFLPLLATDFLKHETPNRCSSFAWRKKSKRERKLSPEKNAEESLVSSSIATPLAYLSSSHKTG